MLFAGTIAGAAAGDVGGDEQLATVGVETEVVGGAVGDGVERVGRIGFPKNQLGGAVENLGVPGEGAVLKEA